MANIIETANTAYEERDKSNDQIQNLKQQAKRESQDFEKDLKELSQIMEKNKKAIDYIKMSEKNQGENQLHEESTDQINKNKPQRIFKDKMISQGNIDKINKYKEEFAKIQAATQIKDFDKLINTFVKNEEENFSMFKYLNEQSNDIEELEKVVTDLKKEKDTLEGQGSTVDAQRRKHLKELEEKLSRSEIKSEEYEYKYHEAIKTISSLTN